MKLADSQKTGDALPATVGSPAVSGKNFPHLFYSPNSQGGMAPLTPQSGSKAGRRRNRGQQVTGRSRVLLQGLQTGGAEALHGPPMWFVWLASVFKSSEWGANIYKSERYGKVSKSLYREFYLKKKTKTPNRTIKWSGKTRPMYLLGHISLEPSSTRPFSEDMCPGGHRTLHHSLLSHPPWLTLSTWLL